jgi:hypothetical protein
VIRPSPRPLPDNTRHSQQTNIHAPSWIRTHDLSRRAAADLRLRPRGHWDRRIRIYKRINSQDIDNILTEDRPMLFGNALQTERHFLSGNNIDNRVSSGFRRDVNYICALLGSYKGRMVTPHRCCESNYLQGPSTVPQHRYVITFIRFVKHQKSAHFFDKKLKNGFTSGNMWLQL